MSSNQLVHSVGFSPDKSILPNLSTIAAAGHGNPKHFLVFGLPGRFWLGDQKDVELDDKDSNNNQW